MRRSAGGSWLLLLQATKRSTVPPTCSAGGTSHDGLGARAHLAEVQAVVLGGAAGGPGVGGGAGLQMGRD